MKFGYFAVKVNCLNLKINSNCTNKSIRISVILQNGGDSLVMYRNKLFFSYRKTQKETCFSDTGISNY